MQVDNQITSGPNWVNPNPFVTLQLLDQVSNECCKIIDSAQLVFRQFAGGDKPETMELRSALGESIDEINGYFGELNTNRRLLTILQ